MDIAALSMAMSQSKVMEQVNISLLKKTMDSQEQNGQQLLSMLNQQPVAPMKPGTTIDMYI